MTKVLVVYDLYDDFGALVFEQSGLSVEEMFEKASEGHSNSNGFLGEIDMVIDGSELTFKAYRFGEVDENFIELMRSKFVEDSANINFYIVPYDGSLG